MSKLYVQYGCGLTAPEEWLNFDASPTLKIQKTPVLGAIMKKRLNTWFPDNVRFGDIIKGLPVKNNSCDGIYCSHTLEHLSLTDLKIALKHTYDMLKPGGIFRCVVPDLEFYAKDYIKSLEASDRQASMAFMTGTSLGIVNRSRGIKGLITSFFGNSHHLWMWDYRSLSGELSNAGFVGLRRCQYNDSNDEFFKLVEDPSRFVNAVAIESSK